MKKNLKTRVMSLVFAATLVVPLFATAPAAVVDAKASVKIAKKVTVSVNATKKLKVTKKGVKKIVKLSAKSADNSVAEISRCTKKAVYVKGTGAGAVKVSVKVKYTVKGSSKKFSKKLNCKVTVKNSDNSGTSDVITTIETQKPVDNQKDTTPTDNPNQAEETATPEASPTEPGPTPSPKPTRTPGPENLLDAMSYYVTNVGTCISWNGQVADGNTTAFIKQNYNSLTAENNNKPNAILGYSPNLVSTSSAASRGILVPDGYTEANVPQLNYSNIDALMKYCADNHIRMRYHGLLWHEQTSNWFFRQNYNSGSGYVSPAIMDKRIEYYIMNVINHISTSQYKDVVYCYDVVNEFYHMTECISRITEGKKDKQADVRCYYEVYKGQIFTNPSDPAHSKVVDNPAYVKKAFKCAYEMLKKFNLLDKVELVYNDYDTNFPDVRESILAVTSYINEKDELNPNGDKYVTTIGMQCHDSLGKFFVSEHEESMTAFAETGLNLQVTEMDLALNGHSQSEQLEYWTDFINLIATLSNNGVTFTSFTWWGMTDKASWLGMSESPLLCGNSISDKKQAYYKVIEAAYSN